MNKLYQEKQNITNGGKNNNYTFLLDNQKTNLLAHIPGASFNLLIFKKKYFKTAYKNRNILNKINLLAFYFRNLGSHLLLLLFFFTRLRKVPSLGSGLKAGWGSDEALAKADNASAGETCMGLVQWIFAPFKEKTINLHEDKRVFSSALPSGGEVSNYRRVARAVEGLLK